MVHSTKQRPHQHHHQHQQAQQQRRPQPQQLTPTSQRQPQPPQQQLTPKSSNLEAAAAAAASLLKAKQAGTAVAARADAMHGGGTAHDQLQKRIFELEARLHKSEVRFWHVTWLHMLVCGSRLLTAV